MGITEANKMATLHFSVDLFLVFAFLLFFFTFIALCRKLKTKRLDQKETSKSRNYSSNGSIHTLMRVHDIIINMKTPHFYAVIIGSEILNARREDKHFLYLRDTLLRRGYTLFSSCIIKDDPTLIHNTFSMIKNDPEAVMFSFGGIGSTPDDLTRQIASDVFSDGVLVPHKEFTDHIIERFGEAAYPHRIHMAELPKHSRLLYNVINNMSGFFLEDRYFFMPGFPEMSHPMVEEALERFYPQAPELYRNTLIAKTSENTLIDVMKKLDEGIDFSSLPMMNGGNPTVEISVASTDKGLCDTNFQRFIDALESKFIAYNIIKIT